jgi:soluble lytic murein transglycosylase-like protein
LVQVVKWLCYLVVPAALAQPARSPIQEAMEKQRAAAAVQRIAVRQQAEMAAQWWLPAMPATEAPEAECSPIPDVELTPMIDAAAQTHSVQPKLLRAVMEQESGLRPCAVSPKGAQGLMQLMPDTAGQLGVEDPFDPKQNIEGGARFLKQLLDKYKGDLPLALGAYNAGPSAVDQTGKVPDIPETRDYVAAILKKMLAAQPSEPKPVAPIAPASPSEPKPAAPSEPKPAAPSEPKPPPPIVPPR